MNALYAKRKLINYTNLTMSYLTIGDWAIFLCWILFTLFKHGFAAITPSASTQMTPAGRSGGLANAARKPSHDAVRHVDRHPDWYHQRALIFAEYGNRGWLAPTTRFINDILLSAPSIVIGLFVYELYVVRFKFLRAGQGPLRSA